MIERDVDLLFEVGSLRHLPRNWRQFGGLDFANVAEHSFRVGWLAVVLAVLEGADPARAALLALIHDAPESRVGDRNYVQRVHTTQDVEQAFDGLTAGTVVEGLARDLWTEWVEAETLEAIVAHDADILDCDLELRERSDAGATLPSMLAETRLMARSALRTRAGIRMWNALRDHSSHRWHLLAKNRLNAGDWTSSGDATQ